MAQKPNQHHDHSHSKDGKAALEKDAFQCCENDIHGSDANDIHRKGSAWSLTNMPKEIAEYAIDRPVNFDTKAADMKKHTGDEDKDIFQRTLLILQGSEFGQKEFAGGNLVEMTSLDLARTFKDIIPVIESELKKNTDSDFHESVANSISKVVVSIIAKNQQQAKYLINIAGVMAASPNVEVSKIWHKCFESLIDSLSLGDSQREIVPHVTDKFGKENASTSAKRVAGKLIGKLATKLPEDIVSNKLYPTVEILCKDKDSTVRGTMVVRLPEVITKLKDKDRVFPVLATLLNDTDPHVMAALVGALGKAVTLMNPKDPKAVDFFKTTIPVFKKFVKKAYVDRNTEVLVQFTTHVGEMSSIFSANNCLSNGDKLWFLDAYFQLCHYGLPNQVKSTNQAANTGFMNFRANLEFNKRHSLIEALISTGAPDFAKESATAATLAMLKSSSSKNKGGNVNNNKTLQGDDNEWVIRANAAAGFPAFLKFAKPLVDFRHGLHPMVVELMHDPNPAVRAKMAEKIYPIMKSLGPEGSLLHGEVVYALSDENVSVIEAILPHLADMLRIFVQTKVISPESMTNATVEIGGALLFCEERLSQQNDWRVHATMLEQLAVLPLCLPGDHVYNNFVPALFHRLLHMRQLPCRIAAADAIVAFLRQCRRTNQREDIRRRIKEGFAHGRSVHDRMLFLFMSKKIMELFSRKYYRDHFFETTLAMADDSVANIRIKTVTMMPDLKSVLQMADDPSLLKKLEETLDKIKNSETDRDVQNAIDSALPEMAKIGVVFNNQKKGQKTKEDLEDEAKEREEDYIASLEPKRNSKDNAKDMSKNVFKSSGRESTPKLLPKPAPAPPPPPKPVPPQRRTLTKEVQTEAHPAALKLTLQKQNPPPAVHIVEPLPPPQEQKQKPQATRKSIKLELKKKSLGK